MPCSAWSGMGVCKQHRHATAAAIAAAATAAAAVLVTTANTKATRTWQMPKEIKVMCKRDTRPKLHNIGQWSTNLRNRYTHTMMATRQLASGGWPQSPKQPSAAPTKSTLGVLCSAPHQNPDHLRWFRIPALPNTLEQLQGMQ